MAQVIFMSVMHDVVTFLGHPREKSTVFKRCRHAWTPFRLCGVRPPLWFYAQNFTRRQRLVIVRVGNACRAIWLQNEGAELL